MTTGEAALDTLSLDKLCIRLRPGSRVAFAPPLRKVPPLYGGAGQRPLRFCGTRSFAGAARQICPTFPGNTNRRKNAATDTLAVRFISSQTYSNPLSSRARPYRLKPAQARTHNERICEIMYLARYAFHLARRLRGQFSSQKVARRIVRLPGPLDILHGSFEPAVVRAAGFHQALKSVQFARVLAERSPVSTFGRIVGPHAYQTIVAGEGFGISSMNAAVR